MEKYLASKKILFIAPVFFGYEQDIQTELEKQGAEVTFIGDNKPIWSSSNLASIENLVKKEYNYLFVIKGEFVQVSVLKLFKESNPKAECILYQYDTLKRYPHLVKLFHLFDRVYSFDIEDCEKYNLILRPLFFVKTKENNSQIKYDVSTICSYYPERQEMLTKLKKQFKKDKISYYFYVYLHWKNFVKNFLKAGGLFLNINLKRLSKEKMFAILNSTKAILDIPAKEQIGLTMRTFEIIGQQKKLITSNPTVVKYDFYNPKNVFLLNESNVQEIKSFLKVDIEIIPMQILEKYSISFFCKSIFLGLTVNYLNTLEN